MVHTCRYVDVKCIIYSQRHEGYAVCWPENNTNFIYIFIICNLIHDRAIIYRRCCLDPKTFIRSLNVVSLFVLRLNQSVNDNIEPFQS